MDARVEAVITIMRAGKADHVESLSVRLCEPFTCAAASTIKKETGLSPMEYLRDLRMQRAEHLLRSTFLTIKEVGFHAGAGDISHFVRQFKRRYGATPSQYRVRHDPQ